VRLLQRSSKSGEDCSGGVLFPLEMHIFREKKKQGFSHMVSSNEIAPRKILLLGEIQG
jgi:hypothetical protein